jgi:hypothetical protein
MTNFQPQDLNSASPSHLAYIIRWTSNPFPNYDVFYVTLRCVRLIAFVTLPINK